MASQTNASGTSNGPDWAMITLLRGGMLGGKRLNSKLTPIATADND